jgi:hypothetical protein
MAQDIATRSLLRAKIPSRRVKMVRPNGGMNVSKLRGASSQDRDRELAQKVDRSIKAIPTTVMLRESGASSTPRLLDSIRSALEYWFARSSRAKTSVDVLSDEAASPF